MSDMTFFIESGEPDRGICDHCGTPDGFHNSLCTLDYEAEWDKHLAAVVELVTNAVNAHAFGWIDDAALAMVIVEAGDFCDRHLIDPSDLRASLPAEVVPVFDGARTGV